jgi:hypothetical protein
MIKSIKWCGLRENIGIMLIAIMSSGIHSIISKEKFVWSSLHWSIDRNSLKQMMQFNTESLVL